jgi:hypothetical protein
VIENYKKLFHFIINCNVSLLVTYEIGKHELGSIRQSSIVHLYRRQWLIPDQ